MSIPVRQTLSTRSRLEKAPVIEPRNRADFRRWLETGWESQQGSWVVYTKKSAENLTLSYTDIVEECLCFGWIDSTSRKVDEERAKIYVCPRKSNSGWSSVNKKRIEKLKAQGLINQAGLECIDRAKEHGSWTRFDDAEALAIPVDLQKELKKYPNATINFDGFPNSAKKSLLQWIFDAKRPETRVRRIQEIAVSAEEDKRAR